MKRKVLGSTTSRNAGSVITALIVGEADPGLLRVVERPVAEARIGADRRSARPGTAPAAARPGAIRNSMKRCCSPNIGRRPTAIRSSQPRPFSARMMVVFRTGWKQRFKLLSATMQTLRTLDALQREGLLTPDPRLAAAAHRWRSPSRPRCWRLIDRADPAHDPIARQFLPERRRDRGRARRARRPDRRRGALAGRRASSTAIPTACC